MWVEDEPQLPDFAIEIYRQVGHSLSSLKWSYSSEMNGTIPNDEIVGSLMEKVLRGQFWEIFLSTFKLALHEPHFRHLFCRVKVFLNLFGPLKGRTLHLHYLFPMKHMTPLFLWRNLNSCFGFVTNSWKTRKFPASKWRKTETIILNACQMVTTRTDHKEKKRWFALTPLWEGSEEVITGRWWRSNTNLTNNSIVPWNTILWEMQTQHRARLSV